MEGLAETVFLIFLSLLRTLIKIHIFEDGKGPNNPQVWILFWICS